MEKLHKRLQKALESGKESDKAAFYASLYDQMFFFVFSIAKKWRSEEPDDIVSEVFYKILCRPLKDFLQLIEENKLTSFILSITVNYCKSLFSKEKRNRENLEIYIQRRKINAIIPVQDQNKIQLDLALFENHLTKTEIQVIKLRFYCDLEYCEITEELGLPNKAAVRKHASRAIQKLRKHLKSSNFKEFVV